MAAQPPGSRLQAGVPGPIGPRYFPRLYQKHERGARLCVWLKELLENDRILPRGTRNYFYARILGGFYLECLGILFGFHDSKGFLGGPRRS